MSARRPPAERAARLLHWYPRPWRDRYGAEFIELLISDIEERPRSLRRAVDVARGGLVARLTQGGLAGCPLPAPGRAVTPQLRYRQASASLGSLSGVLAGLPAGRRGTLVGAGHRPAGAAAAGPAGDGAAGGGAGGPDGPPRTAAGPGLVMRGTA